MTLPITFDYSGGRKDTFKSKKLWAVILAIVGVIVAIGIATGDQAFYIKFPLAALVAYIFAFVIRQFLLGEYPKREAYKGMLDADYKLAYREFWGIFSVESTYPYYCRFRNGKSGVYIKLNKDVILGKHSESEYEHYEAIADAYNLAGSGRVQMVHIDYMDNVGTDERLEDSFVALEDVTNPDLRDLLTDVYSYQQRNLSHRVTTFDVYAFMWTGNDVTAWNTITRILNCFLDANYRSYQILDEKGLRDLTKIILNLNDFSVTEASSQSFETKGNVKIIPISITDADGLVEKLNKTAAEKKAESDEKKAQEEAKAREIERRKQLKKNSKKKKSKSKDDVFEDIF